MATAIFVNLPVSNVQRSSSFFTALGYTINPQFSDDSTACVVFSDTIYAMLLAEARFKDFTPKVVADARTATEAIICLGAASRADVDRIADAALADGGGASSTLRTTASCTGAASPTLTVTSGRSCGWTRPSRRVRRRPTRGDRARPAAEGCRRARAGRSARSAVAELRDGDPGRSTAARSAATRAPRPSRCARWSP